MLVDAAPPMTDGPAQGDGLVSRQSVTLFSPPNPLQLESGKRLGPITIAYETLGTLSPQRDNAIFICHALTGDAHVAGRHKSDDRKPGWWDGFVGPGKGIDTNRYFVICANILGGCQGTTGPSSLNPATGRPYGLEFPLITVSDLVNVHKALVDSLGIEKLLAVVGGSLGGMQVLEWAARYPDHLVSAIVLASAFRLNPQAIAFDKVGRRAIVTDPCFRNGDYYGQAETPRFGLALARMIAHITYLSEQSIENKFGRRLQGSAELAYDLTKETEFQIESYLDHQGKRFVDRFDANSYLVLTRVMDYFDLEATHGPLTKCLGATSARFLVVSYEDDWLFPTAHSKAIVRALVEARRNVTFTELPGGHGHDSFLIDSQFPLLRQLVEPFLDSACRDASAMRR
jgi:homoserine O-acetyltransferase/O-succinyltransferase